MLILTNIVTMISGCSFKPANICFRRKKKMEKKSIDKLIGRYCKIVTREPGEERAHVVFGMVTDIDHDAGFIMIESNQGLGCLNIKAIEAIKPSSKIGLAR